MSGPCRRSCRAGEPAGRLAASSPARRRRTVDGRSRSRDAHGRCDARGARPADREGAGPARAERDDPVLRGVDADAGLVRGRGEEPVRRRREHRGGDLVGDEGRVAGRHGADGRGARRPDAGDAPCRSGAPYLAAEVFGGSVLNGGDGWHAHPTQALLDLYTLRSRLRAVGRRAEGRDPRRRAALARRALEHLDAHRRRRRPLAVRPTDAPAWVRGVGGRGAAAGRRFHVTSVVDGRCGTRTSSWRSGSSASGWRRGCSVAPRVRGAVRAHRARGWRSPRPASS